MFRLLIDQAVELNEQQKKEKGYNPILQAIILLLADHAQRYNIVLNDDWFTEFCNAYHDMDALYKKDKQLNSFIFERFIAKNEIIPKQEFSLNKYPSSVKVDHYQFQGAQSLKVNFQEETKLPKGNTVFLSNDPDGRDPVETRQVVKSLNVIWADSPIGPDINRSDNNLRVTRTDSSNWGNVLMSQSFNKGIVRVTYFIENDGDSSYLYIGVFATANEYPMSTCIGSDCGHKVWSWKKTGEFHRNGE